MGINGGLFYKPANVTDCVKMFAAALAIGISLFHLYTGAMGIIQAYALRTIHLLTLMTLIFLFYPTGKGEDDKKTISWLDIALAGACLAIDIYLLYNNERYTTREWYVGEVTEIDFAVGWMTVALLLEATRRVTGWALPLVAMTFILYTLFGSYLPYPFTIRSPSFTLFIDHAFMTQNPIWAKHLGNTPPFGFF